MQKIGIFCSDIISDNSILDTISYMNVTCLLLQVQKKSATHTGMYERISSESRCTTLASTPQVNS